MRTTFVPSQRGASSRANFRQVLKRVQDRAEIIPKEPGQVMLLREARFKRSSRSFKSGAKKQINSEDCLSQNFLGSV